MENRIGHLFLMTAAAAVAAPAGAQQGPAVTPEVERREIQVAAIDAYDWSLGVFYGTYSAEDFGVSELRGARFGFHMSEAVFFEAGYGEGELEETSFERDSLGGIKLLSQQQRALSYYHLSAGYDLLPGEAFVGDDWAFDTAFYLNAGVGSTEFAGDDRHSWHYGGGYRVVLRDWLAWRFDARDYVFDSDVFGENKTFHNLTLQTGFSFYF